MFIGVARYDLFIPMSASLKDKRQVLRSVNQTIQKKFNVAISEVDHQNLWQRAALEVTCVAESGGHCRKVLDEVERTIEKIAADRAEIIERRIEIMSMEDL